MRTNCVVLPGHDVSLLGEFFGYDLACVHIYLARPTTETYGNQRINRVEADVGCCGSSVWGFGGPDLIAGWCERLKILELAKLGLRHVVIQYDYKITDKLGVTNRMLCLPAIRAYLYASIEEF